MKRIDLLGKLCPIAIVAHDIIGSRQALLARGLRGHDRPDFRGAHPVAGHHTLDLQAFWTVDDQDAVATLAIGPGLDQQWHGQDDIGRSSRSAALGGDLANQRMEDGF